MGRRLLEVFHSHREADLFREYCRVVEEDVPLIRDKYSYEDPEAAVALRSIVDLRATRLDDGCAVIWRDVRDRVEREAALARLNTDLEGLVARRTEELELANDELEAFCYSVSHDLRAPLRSLSGFSRILLADYAGDLDERAKHFLSRINHAAGSMGTLIDDLLQLSRTMRSAIKPGQVDLSALVGEICSELKEEHPGRDVQVELQEGMTSFGDRNLLRAALFNLLDNAWKFTSKNEVANIEVGSFRKEGEEVFYVRDNGAGFDMEYRDKLFLPFQRLHRSDEFEGTGVGLATVERVIRRHNGRVWAEGSVGEGATVYFTLRLEEKEDEEHADSSD